MAEDEVEALIAQLKSTDDLERRSAARRLAERGDPSAIEPLLDCYLDPNRRPVPDLDGDISVAIPFATRQFGESAAQAVIRRMYPNGQLIWLLGLIGHISAVDVLIDLYHQPAYQAQAWPIVVALGNFPSERARDFLESEIPRVADGNLRNVMLESLYYIRKKIAYHAKKTEK